MEGKKSKRRKEWDVYREGWTEKRSNGNLTFFFIKVNVVRDYPILSSKLVLPRYGVN